MKTFKLTDNEIGYTKFLFEAKNLEDAKEMSYKYAINNNLIDCVSVSEYKDEDEKGYGIKNDWI